MDGRRSLQLHVRDIKPGVEGVLVTDARSVQQAAIAEPRIAPGDDRHFMRQAGARLSRPSRPTSAGGRGGGVPGRRRQGHNPDQTPQRQAAHAEMQAIARRGKTSAANT